MMHFSRRRGRGALETGSVIRLKNYATEPMSLLWGVPSDDQPAWCRAVDLRNKNGGRPVKNWTVRQKLTGGFALMVAMTVTLGALNYWTTARVSTALDAVSEDYIEESNRAGRVEREVLNARIHFIYHMTVQKQGALDKGWQRFRTYKEELSGLRSLIEAKQSLAELRPAIAQLIADTEKYEPALRGLSTPLGRARRAGRSIRRNWRNGRGWVGR